MMNRCSISVVFIIFIHFFQNPAFLPITNQILIRKLKKIINSFLMYHNISLDKGQSSKVHKDKLRLFF